MRYFASPSAFCSNVHHLRDRTAHQWRTLVDGCRHLQVLGVALWVARAHGLVQARDPCLTAVFPDFGHACGRGAGWLLWTPLGFPFTAVQVRVILSSGTLSPSLKMLRQRVPQPFEMALSALGTAKCMAILRRFCGSACGVWSRPRMPVHLRPPWHHYSKVRACSRCLWCGVVWCDLA